jgi:mRNA interferase MazF
MTAPVRGQVFMVRIEALKAEKPFLVVSNNTRNRNLSSVICARVSTSPGRPTEIPSVVPIEDKGAVVGSVLCDDLVAIPKVRLTRRVGALPPYVMREVNKGLRSALDCEADN